MRFNLVHVLSDQGHNHGMLGYAEVIESVRWGLEALGHQAIVVTNAVSSDSVNIVFGFQMVVEQHMDALPANSILYNMEQLANLPRERTVQQYSMAAARFRIWDYSEQNLKFWEDLHPAHRPILAPIGYAPTLTRIPVRNEQPIDVLFYGLANVSRLRTYYEICAKGLRAVFACGMYGQERDNLIARSKIVLNLNMYSMSRVFEIVRVSYLLANGKAVVSDRYPESVIEPDMLEAVAFAPLEQIAETCQRLAADDAARRELEKRGRQIIERRDVKEILARALEATG